MKISRDWLQNYFESPLPDAEALADALTFHAFEIESVENDILDVKVTPNRGHDALSHRGIAKEISAILNIPMKTEHDPFHFSLDFLNQKTNDVSVSIEDTQLCRRYIAGYIKNVHVGPSPEWLKKSLEAIGQRSINNVVDATNLVMFNIGQPLHAFDADKLGSLQVGVRLARHGEEMEALDHQIYKLTPANLVITAADRPVGIAGVKGGMADGIDEQTKNVVIEAANFDGVSVRKTAQALKLRTDASARFEQQISPELAAHGMAQVVQLMQTIAGGDVAGFIDAYPTKIEQRPVSVSLENINAVLGITLRERDVADAFSRLGFSFEQTGSTFTVTPPFERLDVNIPEDLIEEVGRIVGYENVPAVELPETVTPAVNADFAARENIREWLLRHGFSEVFTSVFAEKGERIVANKVDGVKPYLRSELLTGLREALDKNVRNKELLGESQIRLFEMGTVWRGGKEIEMLGLAVEKVKKQQNAAETMNALDLALGGKGVASVPEEVIELPIAQLAASLGAVDSYAPYESSPAERYQPYSKYPFIVRDVAFWTGGDIDADHIREVIVGSAGDLLVRLDQFDRFEKEGRVSYGFRLVFQSFDTTLTDLDANERMESVYAALKREGFEIR